MYGAKSSIQSTTLEHRPNRKIRNDLMPLAAHVCITFSIFCLLIHHFSHHMTPGIQASFLDGLQESFILIRSIFYMKYAHDFDIICFVFSKSLAPVEGKRVNASTVTLKGMGKIDRQVTTKKKTPESANMYIYTYIGMYWISFRLLPLVAIGKHQLPRTFKLHPSLTHQRLVIEAIAGLKCRCFGSRWLPRALMATS